MEQATTRRLRHLEAEVRALRAFEQAPYRAVVQDMSELVVRWRPDGTRVFVNDAYCLLFGKPRAELLGTTFWDLIREEDRAAVRERIERLCPESPVTTGRHRAVAPGGRIVWMEWTDRALFDEHWRVVEYQSVGRDVTELVQREREQRRVEQVDAVARASGARRSTSTRRRRVRASRWPSAPRRRVEPQGRRWAARPCGARRGRWVAAESRQGVTAGAACCW